MYLLLFTNALYITALTLVYQWILQGSYVALMNIFVYAAITSVIFFTFILKLHATRKMLKSEFYIQSHDGLVDPEEDNHARMNQYAACHFYIDPYIYQLYCTFFHWSFLLILLETFYNIIFLRSYHHTHIPGSAPLYWRDFMSSTEIAISYIYIGMSMLNYLMFLIYTYYTSYSIPARETFKYMPHLHSNEPLAHLLWKLKHAGIGPHIRKKSHRYVRVTGDTLGVGNHMHKNVVGGDSDGESDGTYDKVVDTTTTANNDSSQMDVPQTIEEFNKSSIHTYLNIGNEQINSDDMDAEEFESTNPYISESGPIAYPNVPQYPTGDDNTF